MRQFYSKNDGFCIESINTTLPRQGDCADCSGRRNPCCRKIWANDGYRCPRHYHYDTSTGRA